MKEYILALFIYLFHASFIYSIQRLKTTKTAQH